MEAELSHQVEVRPDPALRDTRTAVGEHVVVVEVVDDGREDCRQNDAVEQRTPLPANHERRRDHQADGEDDQRPAPYVRSDGHERSVALHHEPGVDEPDERDEQADADADGSSELPRNRVDDGLAQAQQDQQRDEHTFDDDDTHGVWPRQVSRAADERERHEGVDAQPGSHRERALGVEAHEKGHHASHQSCDRQELIERESMPRAVLHATEDAWVDEQDVGHRQEGGSPADELGMDRGPLRCDAEVPVEPPSRLSRSCDLRRCYLKSGQNVLLAKGPTNGTFQSNSNMFGLCAIVFYKYKDYNYLFVSFMLIFNGMPAQRRGEEYLPHGKQDCPIPYVLYAYQRHNACIRPCLRLGQILLLRGDWGVLLLL
jgi:hypothetical protein